VHQSNGRGGLFERSWNRGYGEAIYSGANWLFSAKAWGLIFQDESSNLHNPDIADYLGYGRLLFAIKTHKNTFSFMVRNELESHFTRGAEQITWSFPLHGHFLGYMQMFSGYGQSLIEYNHYTNSAGFGIAFNDWI
jgi:phospholipase A1